MSAAVLQFPIRRASRRRRGLPAIHGCAQVIRFPGGRSGPEPCNLGSVVSSVSDAGGCCAAVPDGDTVFVSGWLNGAGLETFLICRSGCHLLLLDAQNSADWRLLGTFEGAEDLTRALVRNLEDRATD